MNKTTARELLAAYDEIKSGLKRIRARQIKIIDNEFDKSPHASADFQYFGDKLEEALNDIEHRISDVRNMVLNGWD